MSESGLASDTLIIEQDENYGLISDKTDLNVEGNGGEIIIPINTNINGIQIQTPEWIKQIAKTKSLSTKEYAFIIDPNEADEVRNGQIIFSGNNESITFNIHQDVINPIKVYALPFPNIVSRFEKIKIPLNIYPENASLKNVKFVTSNNNICQAYIDNNSLILDVKQKGEVSVTCMVNNEELWSLGFNCYNSSDTHIWLDNETKILQGSNIEIKSNIPLSYFSFSTTTPELITINSDNTITANYVNTGVAEIIATDINSQDKFILSTNIVDIILENDITNYSIPYKGLFRANAMNRVYIYQISLIDHKGNTALVVYGDNIPSNNSTNVYYEYLYDPQNGLFKEDLEKHTFKCRYALWKNDGTFENRTEIIPFHTK